MNTVRQPIVLTGLLILVMMLMTGMSPVAQAKTYVFVQNNTDRMLTIGTTRQAGTSLSRQYWNQISQRIRPGEKAKVLQLNRNKGIKNGRTYFFYTDVYYPGIGSIVIKQKLRGAFVNSHMWQSAGARANVTRFWHDDRRWYSADRTNRRNNRILRATYRAVRAGTDDDIIYVITDH